MATKTKSSFGWIDPRNAAKLDSILWLDERCETKISKRKAEKFQVVRIFRSFTTPKTCEEYVHGRQKQSSDPSIVIIISGAFSRSEIPVLEKYSCVLAFIIYCGDKSRHEDLRYSKLCGIFDSEVDVYHCLRNFLTFQIDTSTTYVFAIPNVSIQESAFRETEKDRVMLLWYNTFNKFVGGSDYFDVEMAKNDLIGILREKCTDNQTWQTLLERFIKESIEENANNAVKWYSLEFALYRSMNEAFRSEDLQEIYKYRYMIKLICTQLSKQQKLFVESFRTLEKQATLKLYRGESVQPEYISQMRKNIGKIVLFKGFWSTSSDEKIAKRFMNQRFVEGQKRILFFIQVDATMECGTVFADITEYAAYKESEHLFSIGSMFRIESIELKQESDPYYQIQLSLSEGNQSAVNHYIEENYSDDQKSVNQAILFGKLIFDMGEKHFALAYLRDIYNYLPKYDGKLRAIYYNNLGFCYNAVGDRERALEHYQNALKLLERLGKDFALHSCYQNIACVYFDQKKNDEASLFAMKAAEQPVQREVDYAVTFDLLGLLELQKKRYSEAQELFERSLRIRQKHYEPHHHTHPAIATSYENFGIFHRQQSHYTEALRWFQEALRIYSDNYVQIHPSVLRVQEQIDSIRQQIQPNRRSAKVPR